MKVIFTEDVPSGGRVGEMKEVSRGYAKNYLLPQGLAVVATQGMEKRVKLEIEGKQHRKSAEHARFAEMAARLEGTEVHIHARVGADERLFGSVTAADIAEELSKLMECTIDKKNIELEKPLRQTGSYPVVIRFSGELRPKVTVIVEQ
ncbi:MAG: 50S ribosomal protein L9 [Dehalococcoidia bacterium]|nr:50S ribosomal protein L9 [Dehalococcoidia bacterium]